MDRANKQWTQEEYDLLAEEWGMFSIETIAAHLGRSPASIKIKASKLNLGAHVRSSPLISLNVLLTELGLSKNGSGYSWNLKKLEEAGLKIHKHRVQNQSFRMVDIAEFWEFAEKNRHLFDFSKLEENVLGAEPKWVKTKRREDFQRRCAVKPSHTKWTEAEEKELLRLLRMHRYTYPEIAERLHRSEGSITRRMQDLGLKERPVNADKQSPWTAEQLRTITEMIKSGSNYENMSRAIGKSAKAIRGKVFTMYLTENLNKVSKLIGDGQWGDNRPDRTLSQKLLMTVEEKAQVKEEASKLVGLLTYRIRQHFEDQDNWQRHLCRNWHETKGCTVGGVDCDGCAAFARIHPQNCVRCGATFYESQENRMCERCRVARKKAGYRKYMKIIERDRRTKQ